MFNNSNNCEIIIRCAVAQSLCQSAVNCHQTESSQFDLNFLALNNQFFEINPEFVVTITVLRIFIL
jgi:hypothetical protein